MQCEMCGKSVPRTRKVIVERTEMSLCNDCSKFGTEATPEARKTAGVTGTVGDRLAARARRMGAPSDALASGEEEIVPDYGQRIMAGRQKKGWTREQLADKIGEPVPTVAKFESNTMVPSDRALSALQKQLNIKLKEKVDRAFIQPQRDASQPSGLTLGDLIKKAQKDKK